MINSIDKLENLGIYSCIPPKTVDDFKRYNLIYGWNGSGKSTLSRLFDSFGRQELPSELNALKLIVTIDGHQYSENELHLIRENIAVFNDAFIRDNIDWNGTLKSILLLDEGDIESTKEYKSLKEELFGREETKGLIANLKEKEDALKKTAIDIQKILTNIGKNVKNNYQLLDTADTFYLNYDRRKVTTLLDDKINPLSETDVLKPYELDKAIKQAKPVKKDTIEIVINTIDIESLREMVKVTNEIANRLVISKVINELRDNSTLATWVERGLIIHNNENRAVCAFCGGNISEERIVLLQSHFNNAINMLKIDIEDCLKKWELFKINSVTPFVNTSIYYDELIPDIRDYNEEYRQLSLEIDNDIDAYVQVLCNKKDNPFYDIKHIAEEKIIVCMEDINNLLKKYENAILIHNKKTATFDKFTKAVKKKIERHYVQEQIKTLSYNEKKNAYDIDFKKLQSELGEKERKIIQYDKLENELSNETLGAEEFNQKLEMFLGYDEIKLEFDSTQKGYKIYRYMREEVQNLSEGEKTAIAFIYFIIKLKENGRAIEDYVLVIDDPISSLDSNKLFSSYAYMKSECENAKQIFILTHNYNYFSLVLGWFCKKHENETIQSTKKKVPAFALYRIENKIKNGKRIAILCNGGESMKQSTEYDYVFYTVYSMRDTILSKQERIFCGNVCRKLVESFLSFKFPKQRSDLMALLQAALPNKENAFTRERIYKFVNIYSHEKKINVFDELDSDILDANSKMVINDILGMIKDLDINHYESMVDKIKDEL